MTNRAAELVLETVYGQATKQLLDLVMGAEKAFDDFGKKSIFGKDKGKEAEQKFTAALVLSILALERAGNENTARLLAVIDAERGRAISIISARKATRHERGTYEQS